MKTIPAKTIVSKCKNANTWFGHDYNMNIYKGCNQGCIYCDSRSECYQIKDFDVVCPKENAISIINTELHAKRKTGVIATGAMSDPYNSLEKELELTREALKIIHKTGFGVKITTKSDLVTRDIDILKAINECAPVCVGLTITTFSDELSSKIEPGAPSSSRRFAALETLAKNGIFCGVLMLPILPLINDTVENIEEIARATANAGGKFIYFWPGVTLRQNQREYFFEQLDKHFPGLRAKYSVIYGNSYECLSPYQKKLFTLFPQICESYQLLHKMPDIIAAYKVEKERKQLSLFP